MILAPSVHVNPRLRPNDSRWELALRYIAATAATLLAIAGAQLRTPNALIWILTALTLVGVPVSLYFRLGGMRLGRFVVPRPLLNSATVIASFVAAFFLVILPLRASFGPVLDGEPVDFLTRFGNGEPVGALMQLFLIFAAFRSFAIISDKDATLTTVPSFSVLLLMIPLHQGIEVVLYFIVWTFVAATLFALDQRAEVRIGVSATVPAIVAGQDVRLGARSLATILCTSLLAALGVSFFLASRNPEDRSTTETAVTALATRLTNLALTLPEVSVNSGPERQIDFKNGPNLPSRAPLWRVEGMTFNQRPVFPAYWRMFTLSTYSGASWLQTKTKISRVTRTQLSEDRFPLSRLFGLNGSSGDGSRRGGTDTARRRDRFSQRGFGSGFGGFDQSGRRNVVIGSRARVGYDMELRDPIGARQFDNSGVLVLQTITSMMPNIGFVPVLPPVRVVRIRDGQEKDIRLRGDGAIDVGVLQIGQTLRVLSDVPPLAEYGVPGKTPPMKRASAAQVAASGIAIPASDRALNLRLPKTVPARVRQLSGQILKRINPQASNYAKASRLALSIQQDAIYTLRPPAIPEGRDATDFFLFEGRKRGYCTYFAGALTVLCRAEGIPARVVSGFTGLDWQGPEAGILREGNAHAWTEVWVDGFGWALVDATPAGDRGDNSPTWLESWSDIFSSTLDNATMWLGEHHIALALAILPLFCLAIIGGGRGRRLLSWRWKPSRDDDFERRAVAQTYRRTARALARKFRPKTPSETPDEWLQSGAGSFDKPDVEALRRLTALYLAARYDPARLPSGSAALARATAASITWKRVQRAPGGLDLMRREL